MNEATKLAGQSIIGGIRKIKEGLDAINPKVDILAQEGYLEQGVSIMENLGEIQDGLIALMTTLGDIGSGKAQPTQLEPDILATLKAISKLDGLEGDEYAAAHDQIEQALVAGLLNVAGGNKDPNGNYIPLDQLPSL